MLYLFYSVQESHKNGQPKKENNGFVFDQKDTQWWKKEGALKFAIN